jgi:hypothetical protein
MAELYPPIEPYDQGMLDVGDDNRVYWEVCGNPDGKAVMTVLGLILLGSVGTMLSNAPDLAAMIAAFAGIAIVPVVVPYLVVRIVTVTLERQYPLRRPVRDRTEPDTGADPAADD